MLDKLGVEILAGEEAADRFDADRQAERMRAQTAAAVARLKELLIWLKREHDNPEESCMTITDEVAKLITERDAALARERALEDQVERQKGGLLESRAQNSSSSNATRSSPPNAPAMTSTFVTRSPVARASSNIAPSSSLSCLRARVQTTAPDPAPARVTLKSRLKRLAKNGGDAA